MINPCSDRKFLYKTNIALLSKPVIQWFTHLSQRVGLENTLLMWKKAFVDYDDTLLMKILSSGWQRVGQPDHEPADEEMNLLWLKIRNLTNQVFSTTVIKSAIENTPPIFHINNLFSQDTIAKEISAYDVLHIKFDSLAYLAETLIEQFGKEGELIVYDLMLESRLASSQDNKGSVEEFIEDFTAIPDTPDMFSAGLDFEVISKSPKEAILHVKQCEWARYFREHHPNVGYLLACSTDEAGFRAFNQDLRLQRTKTIMEGGELCDFRVFTIAAE